ncbi:hypothetical protein [Acinetobacter colistiniresistens]|uniref:hypothetical protein n=1 Tax=Acinetobacter colistiniresistens TaxID=280145 RepID=UPI00148F1659|nr:hypothetical protein [Acinetobacter colistiniresistens]
MQLLKVKPPIRQLNYKLDSIKKTMLNLQSIATDRVAQENADENGRSAAIRLQYNF